MTTFFAEFENESSGRKYPFAADADLHDAGGNHLPMGLFTDAVIYPESGVCRLASLSSAAGRCTVEVEAGGDSLTGEFRSTSSTVELYRNGVHRGTLVLGPAKDAVLEDPTVHKYEKATFCTACQFRLPSHGVSSMTVAGSKLTGPVEVVSDTTGSAVVRPVISDNDDGSCTLRFDVVPSNGILAASKTGVRKIFILREPGSYFNLFETENHEPYLYLTRTGLSDGSSLIRRSDLCVSSNKAVEDAKNRSRSDDCGDAGSVASSSTGSSTCFPWFGTSSLWKYLIDHDPQTTTSEYEGITYGYLDIPARLGFHAGTSMSLMFVETNIQAKMFALGYAVYVRLDEYRTRAASELFFHDTEVKNYGTIVLKPEALSAFIARFTSVKPGNKGYSSGYMSCDDVIDACDDDWIQTDTSFPDDWTDERRAEFNEDLRKQLAENGYDTGVNIRTNRAIDLFSSFNCKNWVKSDLGVHGNSVKYLVNWGGLDWSTDATGVSYVTINSAKVPRWVVARYLWWKYYAKTDNEQIRWFIVPAERGLVIYTGDYYYNGDPSKWKETSPLGWGCPGGMQLGQNEQALEGHDSLSNNADFLWDVMRDKLYDPDDNYVEYDPTFGDNVFPGTDQAALERLISEPAVPSVGSSTRALQPEDAPVIDRSALGPLEYKYGRLFDAEYGPTGGYPDTPTDSEKEAMAIKAPIEFEFDIDNARDNAFNFDVTDMAGVGFVYDNPIHVTIVEESAKPVSMDVKDPSDSEEVAAEMRKLTSRTTGGNGIEVSVPGLGAST